MCDVKHNDDSICKITSTISCWLSWVWEVKFYAQKKIKAKKIPRCNIYRLNFRVWAITHSFRLWVMLIIYVATVTVECRMAIKVLFLYIKWKLICHVLLHPYSFLLQVNNNKITVFYFVFRSFSQDTKATRMSPVCRVLLLSTGKVSVKNNLIKIIVFSFIFVEWSMGILSKVYLTVLFLYQRWALFL